MLTPASSLVLSCYSRVLSPSLSPLSSVSLSGLGEKLFSEEQMERLFPAGDESVQLAAGHTPPAPSLALSPSFSIPPPPRLPLLGPALNANTPKVTEGAMLGLYC